METKKLTNGFKGPKNISNSEKKCNKCGFVTFSLHVLYSHQHKCKGTLLSPRVCCYCRRKFTHLSLFRQHKRTCLKSIRRRKSSEKILIKNRLKANGMIGKEGSSSSTSKLTCPNCEKQFSKFEYEIHKGIGSCSSKPPTKKESFSARKSFSTPGNKKPLEKQSDSNDHLKNEVVSIDLFPENDSEVSCTWCKNVYPNNEILAKHLERNKQCAQARYKPKPPRREVHTARKSIQDNSRNARKSFPNHKHASPRYNSISDHTSGSARKSLPNSSRSRFGASPMSHSSPLKSLNQCPVCYQKIPDPFKFFQHQKKLNHWGKATKSMNSFCKCPFCGKQFVHVRTFNAHVRNHSDVSEKEIGSFLKKTTCHICAQIFASETAKYQHIRIFHSKSKFDKTKKSDSSDFYDKEHSLLPLVLKQKLRMHPNTCPICAKEFPATYFRNKHFQEKHLDAELECKFCPKKFSNADNLENHMQDEHYESFEFECLVCNINLATAPHVVLHCTKVHSNQDPKHFIRSRLDESTVNTPGFEYSQPEFAVNQDEGDDGFYCDICKVSFVKKAGLQSHRLSKAHKDMVVRNLELMRRSLSDLPSPKRAPKVTKKTPEILTCSECFEDFTSAKDFVPHRLSHFGRGKYLKINEMNRYTCEICGEVSNSHSKVQMHLFWHLQVESTLNENSTVKDKSKTDPIVPDRLSGQQVAKKSFGKPSDSQQEIVIGGVKKSLFTCEKCNIGFTTEAHYSLHVRKLCKKKNLAVNTNEKSQIALDEDYSSADSSMLADIVKVEKKNIRYCTICNTLYDSSLKEVHSKFCDKCIQDTSHVKKNSTEKIKVEMSRRRQVATCITCSQLFNNPNEFSKHMLDRHRSLESSVSKETSFKNTILCTACNCLFLSTLTKENHATFCVDAQYHDFDEDSSSEILKPFSQLKGAKAICISCSVVFRDSQTLKKHVLKHKSDAEQENQHNISNKSILLNGPNNMDEDMESGDDSMHKTSVYLSDGPGTSAQKSLDVSSSASNDSSFVANQPFELLEDESEEVNASLRDNFSQLFCLLINDADLMQKLGYDSQPVDDVLINVLQQMGQETVEKNDEISDIDCLRKNIKIFLDFCLKDQIMELIESGKTSIDDIVVEALKTLTNEEANDMDEV